MKTVYPPKTPFCRGYGRIISSSSDVSDILCVSEIWLRVVVELMKIGRRELGCCTFYRKV